MRRSTTLVCIALIGLATFVPLQLLDNDIEWLAFAGAALIITLILITLSIAWRNALGGVILAAFLALAALLLTNDTYALRENIRWIAFAAEDKAAVRAMTGQAPDQLRHVVWDAWGWGGMDTSVYLVYDPANSLVAAARRTTPGRPANLPCPVDRVDRLEPDWYSVRFYTSEDWTSCRP